MPIDFSPNDLSSDPHNSSIQVRFDDECVVIPDSPPLSSPRIPRLVKKSYSVPVWRRRASNSNEAVSPADISEDSGRVVLKLPVYSLSIKTRSLSSSEPTRTPLQSCIAHHQPGSPPLARCTRRELSPSSSRSSAPAREGVVTVPLRPCCISCISSTEKCILKGAEWKEKFTAGARRRRDSASHNHSRSSCRSQLHDLMPGFESVVSVDEVAKKHCEEETEALPEDACDDEEKNPVFSLRRKNLNMDSSDLLSTLAVSDNLPSLETKENDSSLFPLPSRIPLGGCADINAQPLSDFPNPQGCATGAATRQGPCSSPEAEHPDSPPLTRSCGPLSEAYLSDASYASPRHTVSQPADWDDTRPLARTFSRKRSFVHLPAAGSFFRASTEIFKGVGAGVFGGGGVPMSV